MSEDITIGELHRAVQEIKSDTRAAAASSASTATTAAVLGSQVDRLERFVYGALGASLSALITATVTALRKG